MSWRWRPPPLMTVSVAMAQREVPYGVESYCLKEEDFFAVQKGARRTAFGVFDGHGGASVARQCSEHAWVDSGDPLAEHVADAFWRLDAALGPEDLGCGSSASVAVVDHAAGDDFGVTLAWVGDSQIMEINMCAEQPNVTFLTPAHVCGNAAEIDRIHHHWSSREQADGEELKDTDPSATDSVDALTEKSLAYEKRVEAAIRGRLEPSHLERQRSAITLAKPEKLQTRWKADEKTVGGAATRVTRSIGDWDASRTLIPGPDVVERLVTRGEHKRYIVASDGVWAALGLQKVCALGFEHLKDPAKAVATIIKAVKVAHAKSNGVTESPLADDATCIVFDVVPSPHLCVALRRGGCGSPKAAWLCGCD